MSVKNSELCINDVQITVGINKSCLHLFNMIFCCYHRPVLLQRLNECIQLNEEYQKQFQRTKEKLRENPNERQFEFSENYIFGKFDTFCKRLEKIADMVNTMEMFSSLHTVKIEGIDTIAVKYKTIVDATKKKNYNILDHRKTEVMTREIIQLHETWFKELKVFIIISSTYASAPSFVVIFFPFSSASHFLGSHEHHELLSFKERALVGTWVESVLNTFW